MLKPARLFLFMSAFAFLTFASRVSAQTATPSASPQVSLKTQEDQLRATYRQNLDVYRNDERLYVIAREQYYQLNTLTALEGAVQATRKVMLSRMDVLLTYAKLLRVTLSDTPGIEVTQKNANLQSLDQTLITLQKHRQSVGLAVDRPGVNQMVSDFKDVETASENISYTTLGWISYGRIQAVYDKTVSVKDEIKTEMNRNEKDALVLAEKQRGIAEIERELSDVNSQLITVRTHMSQTDFNDPISKYQQTQTDLSTIYAELSHALSLLNEVLKPGTS